MELYAVGGDERFACMAACACAQGIQAHTVGLEHTKACGVHSAPVEALTNADCVVMPNPFGKKGLTAPLATRPVTLEAALYHLSPGAALFLFGEGEIPDRIKSRFDVHRLDEDETLMRDNARLTAEGALCAAMNAAPFALWRANCLILGYGRIASALNELLVGIGAHTTVAARRERARRQAVQRGANAVGFDELDRVLGAQQVIFSTPPQLVLDGALLTRVNKAALVIDLASPPYGVDLEAAAGLGIKAWRESGLPGRFAPQSAGEALLRSVLAALKLGGVRQ